jgi:hypothetical protein
VHSRDSGSGAAHVATAFANVPAALAAAVHAAERVASRELSIEDIGVVRIGNWESWRCGFLLNKSLFRCVCAKSNAA